MYSIVKKIFDNAMAYPDKIAVTNGKKSLTYRRLVESIICSKDKLINEFGIKKGDYVIIAADKQPEFLNVYFACHLIGAITLPIAPDTNTTRYALIKGKIKPVLVVGFKDETVEVAELTSFRTPDDKFGFDTPVFPSLDSVADIMFTTGTTGEPKGVQLTHRNIAAAARNINAFIQNRTEDVEMIALPISHSFGIGRMRCALSNGQTVVLLGNFANVKRFFRFMEEFKVTGFGMVPASWALLKKLSAMKIADYRNQLRYIEIGSAPMPIEEKKVLIDALPDTRICMHYGLTV